MSAATDLVERAEQASACEDWTVAAEAYTAALRLSPDGPPKWHYERARALERAGEARAAADAFAEAVRRRRTAPAWWYYKLAGAQYRLGDWGAAGTGHRGAGDPPPGPGPAR